MAKGHNLKSKAPRGQSAGGMGMMQQMQKLQEQLQKTQEQLADETVTFSAGGGAIKVVATGDQRIKSIIIAPEILKIDSPSIDADAEMLQDLVLMAVNGALDASRELASQRLGPLTGGLPF